MAPRAVSGSANSDAPPNAPRAGANSAAGDSWPPAVTGAILWRAAASNGASVSANDRPMKPVRCSGNRP